MKRIFLLFALAVLCISCNKTKTLLSWGTTDLNSGWKFKQEGETKWMPAIIPGTVHTDLLANNKIEDPFYRTNEHTLQWIDKKNWVYETSVNIDQKGMQNEHVALIFKGLDTYCDIYINDSLLLHTDNMFREWNVECKPYLKVGKNKIKVYFHSPITEGLKSLQQLGYALPADNDQSENGEMGNQKVSPFTRKAAYHYGWDWGPRFVTSGIWRPVYFQVWNQAKINHLQWLQEKVTPESALIKGIIEIQSDYQGPATVELSCKNDAHIKASAQIKLTPGICHAAVELSIPNPKLWWSNGLGEAYLYPLQATLKIGDRVLDSTNTKVGIRTLKVVQKPDSLGKSFYIELNGKPVFMKGANYIPNDNFLPRVSNADYEKVVQSAYDTHMNMLRVWGGGIYENDVFYDLCDQYGILVWQDFMFSCSMYPGDSAFLQNVKQEVIDNIQRLRNHPCLALWCGNNEIDIAWRQNDEKGGWGWKEKFTPQQRKATWQAYDTLFYKLLPSLVSAYDSSRFYWPSSPLAAWNQHSDFAAHSGDIHYWDVWWGQKPFSEYTNHIGRFMSEYGFQSFPEFNTVKSYTIPSDYDIFSEVMKAHQRSSIGNGTIQRYMEWYYQVPKDFSQYLYVGQLLQAEGIKIAVEAHRRAMPYNMGSLFWQINDCWPVASWSSIDYYHRWKAQQYFVKKANAPVLISPVLDSTHLNVFVVNDEQKNINAQINIKIIDFYGKIRFSKSIPVEIQANSSKLCLTEKIQALVSASDYKHVLLYAEVISGADTLSNNIQYFLPPKSLDLPKSDIQKAIKKEKTGFVLELFSNHLIKNLYLSLDNLQGTFSDNYFDMLPGQTYVIHFKTDIACSLKAFEQALTILNLNEISVVK